MSIPRDPENIQEMARGNPALFELSEPPRYTKATRYFYPRLEGSRLFARNKASLVPCSAI